MSTSAQRPATHVAGLIAQPGPTPADTFAVEGVMKWFDPAKGYGFLIPDDGTDDVMVHVKVVRESGLQVVLCEGSRVVCEATYRGDKKSACAIVSVDNSAVRTLPAHTHMANTHTKVEATWGPELMRFKWFNRAKGFGFFTRGENTADVFVHVETLRQWGIVYTTTNVPFMVSYGEGPKGLMAAEVRPAGAGGEKAN